MKYTRPEPPVRAGFKFSTLGRSLAGRCPPTRPRPSLCGARPASTVRGAPTPGPSCPVHELGHPGVQGSRTLAAGPLGVMAPGSRVLRPVPLREAEAGASQRWVRAARALSAPPVPPFGSVPPLAAVTSPAVSVSERHLCRSLFSSLGARSRRWVCRGTWGLWVPLLEELPDFSTVDAPFFTRVPVSF